MIIQDLSDDSQNQIDISRFNVLEYKTYYGFGRYNFAQPEYLKLLYNEPGIYKSVYLHTESIKEYYRKHGNLDNYEGELYSNYLYMQTNNAHYTASLGDLRRLIEQLEDEYGINRHWMHYLYDGEDNFYIALPSGLFGGFSSSKDLSAIHALISSRISGKVFLNYKVYSSTGLMPLVNTYIKKTERYAIELSAAEVFAEDKDIIQLSLYEKRSLIKGKEDLPEFPSLKELKNEMTELLKLSQNFFTSIFAKPVKGFINIRHLSNKKERKDVDNYSNIFTKTINDAICAAHIYHGRENVFFGIAEREKFGSGKKDNCSKLNVVYADIDYGTEGHKGTTHYATREAVESLIEGLKFKPSIVTHSGHGFQVFWKLNEPIDLKVQDNVERLEVLMKHLNEMLYGDPTQNVDRIFRVPYTKNIKEKRHVMCVVNRMSPDLYYSLEELEEWVASDYKPIPKSAPKASIYYSDKNTPAGELLSEDKWEYIKDKCSWVKEIYSKVERGHNLRHSERFRIASLLMKFNFADDEIHRIMGLCPDYDKGLTNYQIMQIRSAGYNPPLCSKLCDVPCSIIEDVAGRSPITLAYRRDCNE